MTTIPSVKVAKFTSALPFALSLLLIPLAAISAIYGGWWVLLLPVSAWYLFSIIDLFAGLNEANSDTQTPDDQLFWYRAITMIWAPLQFMVIFGMIYYVTRADHLSGWEQYILFIGVGVISGTIGINYSHELMHQKPKIERHLADILLAMVLYSHFRSEHMLVHHRYVGTPRDPVTARYNEDFGGFFHAFCASLISRLSTLKRRCWRVRVCLGRICRIRFGSTGVCKPDF